MLAWHFLPDDGRLAYPLNGERPRITAGMTLHVEPPLRLCRRGLHASKRAIDALLYALGAVIERVELGGEIEEAGDKVCAETRTCLWVADATATLHEFACWCAEDALRAAGVMDERCWAAIRTKRAWLRGDATDGELDAAVDAARGVAWSPAWSPVWTPVLTPAWAAAWDVAWEIARDAAWDDVWDDVWDVAWDVAWDDVWAHRNRRLTAMLSALKPKEGDDGD